MPRGSRITPVEAVRTDSTFVFRIEDEGGIKEAILVRHHDEILAWLNVCQHFTHIRLDKGDGAPMRDGEVICSNHGAMYAVDSGRCTYGPCEGAMLTAVDVSEADGWVHLTDPDYEFVGTGPIPTDPVDLSSRSNVEF